MDVEETALEALVSKGFPGLQANRGGSGWDSRQTLGTLLPELQGLASLRTGSLLSHSPRVASQLIEARLELPFPSVPWGSCEKLTLECYGEAVGQRFLSRPCWEAFGPSLALAPTPHFAVLESPSANRRP